MSDEIVDQDTNPEGDQDTTLEDGSNEELTKAQEVAENQKIRAEKAEKALKALEAKMENVTPKKEGKVEKSNEPDYSEKLDRLTLKSDGIVNPDDQKIVMDEAKRLKLSVDEVLAMDHIKGKLKEANDQREAQAGAPKGKGKVGGSAKDDVDYWIDQKNPDGTYKNPDDLELFEKVDEARINKQTKGSMFSDVMYTG